MTNYIEWDNKAVTNDVTKLPRSEIRYAAKCKSLRPSPDRPGAGAINISGLLV